jgi:hypothetical protein
MMAVNTTPQKQSERNPIRFLLNQGNAAQADPPVESNAFSLTKVLAAGAIIIGPIAAGIVDSLDDLKAHHWVVLAVALLGFLAITASADVLGRSIAASGKSRADASKEAAKSRADASKEAAKSRAEASKAAAKSGAEASVASIAGMTAFSRPLAGYRVTTGQDVAIEVLASATGGYFLVKEDTSLKWLNQADVRIP